MTFEYADPLWGMERSYRLARKIWLKSFASSENARRADDNQAYFAIVAKRWEWWEVHEMLNRVNNEDRI